MAQEYPIEEMTAYPVHVISTDEKRQPGDTLIAVPFSNYRQTPLPGDCLVVRYRSAALTMMQAVAGDDDVVELVSLFDPPVHPDDPQTVVGLVIARQSTDF